MKWKDINGYEGIYSVSETGLVKSCSRKQLFNDGKTYSFPERIKKSSINHRGYLRTQLTDANGNKKIYSVHRLVMDAFDPNGKFHGAEVNHKNGIKTDNRAENLEWVTKQGNEDHAKSFGLKRKGENHGCAILNELSVVVIREAIAKDYPVKDISKYFGVSINTIYAIRSGRIWGWL